MHILSCSYLLLPPCDVRTCVLLLVRKVTTDYFSCLMKCQSSQ